MGTTKKKALKMMAFLWIISVVGLCLGLLVGSIPSSSPWIYSFTAGIFLYLALVDLVSIFQCVLGVCVEVIWSHRANGW